MSANPVKPANNKSFPKSTLGKSNRIDLKPLDFEKLLDDQGSRVRITPSVICPNRTELTDTNHVLDCPLCFGDSTIDLKGQCFETWAFIQGIDLNKELQVQGIFDMKDAKITVSAAVRMYYWYKVEVLDFASLFNQVIKRGTGDSDNLRYIPADSCDTPYFLIDKLGVQHDLNVHYKVVEQQIRWLTPRRPPEDTLYSFVYPVLPTFRIMEFMHENRYYYTSFKQKEKTPVQLPQQALMRWDYIAKGSGSLVENK